MNNATRAIIIAVVVVGAVAVFYLKETPEATVESVPVEAVQSVAQEEPKSVSDESSVEGKAQLLCFGAERCVPCRMMVPVRKALSESYPDTLAIQFNDVWQDRSIGQRHNIRMIPTSIFLDTEGKEIYRQEGFMDKEAIVAKFKELGVDLVAKHDTSE